MIRLGFTSLCFLGTTAISQLALAVSSAEVYTGEAYGYGRFEARLRYAAGDGVISSFFLWKDGSEVTGTFWNELDFEKVGADCHVETNAIYGKPFTNHSKSHTITADPCSTYHTYAYEWTPDSIVWLVDGVELRRETGATAVAFAENAAASGMQIHFNVWPGDATFGGKFSPSILPIHEYVDWVQFSKYAAGTFTVDWRDDFEGNALNARWLTGSWASPKNLSTHAPGNVNLLDGYLVVSLTQDSALGPAGASPEGTTSGGGTGGVPGAGGAGAEAGTAQAAGATSVAGATSMAGATVGVGGAAAAVPTSNPSGSSGCSISAHRNGNFFSIFGAFAAAIALGLRRRLTK